MPHLQETQYSPSQPSFGPDYEREQRVRVKNRRKLYLDRHPSYFTSPDLELCDPLLYDRCVRRFQTTAEREADGKAKGFSGVLEADLYRSEAKLAAMNRIDISQTVQEASSHSSLPAERLRQESYVRGKDGEILPEEEDEVPQSKEEGWERWKWAMTMRFLRGDDEDFDYRDVDEGEEVDEVEVREKEERWFEDEEPEWVESSSGEENGADDEKKKGKGTGGETGIQDF